jgi:hypothetical protein
MYRLFFDPARRPGTLPLPQGLKTSYFFLQGADILPSNPPDDSRFIANNYRISGSEPPVYRKILSCFFESDETKKRKDKKLHFHIGSSENCEFCIGFSCSPTVDASIKRNH